ncbi:MAG: hypothetical protein U0871_07425 [Gemmataceae bacterium]
MPLALTDDGILLEGIHDATVAELGETFGRFNRCGQRMDLFARFENYVAAIRRTEWACTLIVDGSFVMWRVDDPEDVDVVLGYPPEVADLVEADMLRPYQLNVLEPSHCKRTYKIDLKACTVDGPAFRERVEFYAQVSMKRADKHGLPAGSRKGLVRVIL